ncbi:MAG TPA: DUF711 family protein [Pyrodictiaceae archaeon]|nr:DUF711 family protein [Pyrodictiaceae archaeon]HIQ55305.1 DUF711 family protein [Pyrodictium sp.]
MLVRALTLHLDEYPTTHQQLLQIVKSSTEKLRKLSKNIRREIGLEVWSLRISFPPTPQNIDISSLVDIARKLASYRETMFSLIHVRGVKRLDLLELVKISDNLYGSAIIADWNDHNLQALQQLITRLEYHASRIAVVTDNILTPYFPAGSLTHVGRECVSVAYLYTDVVEEKGLEGLSTLIQYAQKVERIIKTSSIGFCGHDLSLSPWGNMSVARALTRLFGYQPFEYGFGLAVDLFNERLMEACKVLTCTGFNEVMLAVAEDNELKRLVGDGLLRLEHLVRLAYASVAGIDMVLLPETHVNLIPRLYLEIMAASRVKKRPLGFRVIVSKAKPREWVEFGMFGKTPVIEC